MHAVVDRVVARFGETFACDVAERQDVAWQRLTLRADAETSGGIAIALTPKRPEWMRVRARFDDGYLELKKLARGLDLHTVCEEAGCPTSTSAGRIAPHLHDQRRSLHACVRLLPGRHAQAFGARRREPQRVADAVAALGLAHAVITCVARDDLADGGASNFAATVDAIRATSPGTAVELLISDCKGDAASLATIFDARPDVLNHNLETVARLQRRCGPRPDTRARSPCSVGARARVSLPSRGSSSAWRDRSRGAGAMADLRAVGVEILTIGQYLRPSAAHVPVAKWWHPDEFAALRDYGEALGFAHVESGPLVRSSYHARGGCGSVVSAPH